MIRSWLSPESIQRSSADAHQAARSLAAIELVLHARGGLTTVARETDELEGLGHELGGLALGVLDELSELLVGGFAHGEAFASGSFEALEDLGIEGTRIAGESVFAHSLVSVRSKGFHRRRSK